MTIRKRIRKINIKPNGKNQKGKEGTGERIREGAREKIKGTKEKRELDLKLESQTT